MLDHDEGHAGLRGKGLEEAGEGVEPSGGGADADDRIIGVPGGAAGVLRFFFLFTFLETMISPHGEERLPGTFPQRHARKIKWRQQGKSPCFTFFLTLEFRLPVAISRGGKMSIVAFSSGRVAPRTLPKKSSKTNGPLVRWRTDLALTVVGVTHRTPQPIRVMPAVGQVIAKDRLRTGILERNAHERALRGESASYKFKLFHRLYRVDLAPRRDRRKGIVGVRGAVYHLGRAGRPAPVREPRELPVLRRLLTHRQMTSLKTARRSLELARTVAESVRVNSEIRTAEASRRQKEAEEALVRAEAEERRARVLADASAVLDTSFDLRELMDRLGNLLIHRLADGCVIHIREGDRLHRMIIDHRDPRLKDVLSRAFPEVDEVGLFKAVRLGASELYSTVTPSELCRIVPAGRRVEELKSLQLQSLIRSPVRSHGRTVGMLTLLSSDRERFYDPSDLKTVERLAHRMALAQESARLYDEAQREIALRKEAEARLRIFNVDLERRVSERTSLLEEAMREANSFAYTVAHDLRAPLRAITGFCQALKEDYAGAVDPVGQDYLDRIVSGARKMDELIRDLLDYARLNRAEIKRGIVDLDAVLDEVVQESAPDLLQRRAEVQRATPLGRIVGHGPMLVQVFNNLLSNAVKFVAPAVKPVVRIYSERREVRVRIVVEDNGIGISPEHQERIFGIFERLNRAEEYPGTGIGLAIVRRAVERLGGSIGVESEPGKGSRFWIELQSA
jgi:signal transduction histidine kinase